MKKVSVVIPTLQKNTELLNNLIKSLDKDDAVTEIIVIDNSRKNYNHKSAKLKVIVPNENLFVNPSWNLGVKTSKEDIVALLNDDITIPQDFCKNIISQMHPQMGIAGVHSSCVEVTREIKPIIESEKPVLQKTDYMGGKNFGIAMFFYKTSYIEIPEDIKIFCGDDWLFYKNKKCRRENYFITLAKIYHYGSLTSKDNFGFPRKHDLKLYRKYTMSWYQYILNFERDEKGIKITVPGLTTHLRIFKN